MTKSPASIPRPLVRTNQWFIFLSVTATWLTGQAWILLLPLIAGLLGMFFNFNPVMRFAAIFLKKKPSEYIPEDKDQQQFNQLIAITLLAIGFIGYTLNWTVLAVAATAMVAAASFIAILGFCVGCFIRFRWQQYRYQKTQNQQ
jgi:energy-converting hydrogenase Eha subunit C